MGVRAFELLQKEIRALTILGIISAHPRSEISTEEIKNEMNKFYGNNFHSNEITREISEINEWATGYGFDKIIERGKSADDARVPIYRLSNAITEDSWTDLVRVAFSIILFKHGDSPFFEFLRDNYTGSLMQLLHALERNRLVEIETINGTRRFIPYRIGFNGAWKIYGLNENEEKDEIAFKNISKITFIDKKIKKHDTVREEIIQEIYGRDP